MGCEDMLINLKNLVTTKNLGSLGLGEVELHWIGLQSTFS